MSASRTKRTKLADEFERLLGADNLPSVWTIHAQDMRVIIAALRERQFGPHSRDAVLERAMTQFSQCVSVLAGQDMTRHEVMVAESRPILQEAIRALRGQSATERSEP